MMKPIHIALVCFLAPLFAWGQYGVLDTTFHGTGTAASFGTPAAGNMVRTVFQQSDGGVMVASSSYASMQLDRFLPDGSRDQAFGNTYTPNANIQASCAVLEQPDGKLMLVGQGEVDTNSVRFIRFLADGQRDVSFGPNGEVTHIFADHNMMTVNGFERLSDGRMLVAGTATSDVGRMYLAMFMADGSSDLSFNGTGMREYDVRDMSSAFDMAIRPDGRVVLAGYAEDGDTRQLALLQVMADGSPDAAFGTSGIVTTDLGFAGHELRAISLGPDGSVLGCGVVEINATDQDALLVRYHPNGALDLAFHELGWFIKDFESGYDEYNDVLLEDDGMIMVTGHVQVISQLPKLQLILDRYYPEGIPDMTFGTNGSTVTSYTFGARGNRLALQEDGKVLVAGSLASGLSPYGLLARFSAGGPTSIAETSAPHRLVAYPNPSSGQLQLDLPSIQKEWDVRFMDTNGRMVKRERIRGADRAMFDVRSLAPGAYQVLLQAGGERYRATFVKIP